jgi:sodium transport system permease protein
MMIRSMNWSNVRLVFCRELSDQLRDRRTLLMIALLPLVLYPLIGISFMQMAQFLKKHSSRVLIVAEGRLPPTPPLVQQGRFASDSAHSSSRLEVDYSEREPMAPDAVPSWAASWIDSGRYDVVVRLPGPLLARINREPTEQRPESEAQQQSHAAAPLIYFNASKDASRIAHQQVISRLVEWRNRLAESPQRTAEPEFNVSGHDVSRPGVRRAVIWSKILPFVVVVWALTGAFYPAIDLCAGEKERGTLETLLVGPAERSEIVSGKLLTVMLFSMTSSLLNLAGMSLTVAFILRQLATAAGHHAGLLPGPPPLGVFLCLAIVLIPLAALFSALAMALAAMARSTKEGQYYLMPLLLATMPLTILPLLPEVHLDPGTCLIPVTGALLLMRELIEGEFTHTLIYSIPVLLVTAGCCASAIRWAIGQFNNEAVLFREGERLLPGLWMRQLLRDRGATPSVAQALLCGLLILLTRFFAGLALPYPSNWNGFVVWITVTLVAFVATPPLVMSLIVTSRPRDTLLLNPTTLPNLVAAALLALSLHPIAVGVMVLVRWLYPMDPRSLAPFATIFEQAPNFGLVVLLVSLLPAICEELAFRGFILSGLRHLGSRSRAIALSAIFFGLAHGVLQQVIITALFGLVLGYVAVQTRSLIPCIVFHAVHNGIGVISGKVLPQLAANPKFDWLIQQVHDPGSPDSVIQVYGPGVILLASIAAAALLKWFHHLPFHPSAEERERRALGQHASHVAN